MTFKSKIVIVIDIDTTLVMASQKSFEYTDDATATTTTTTPDTTTTDSSQTLSTQQG